VEQHPGGWSRMLDNKYGYTHGLITIMEQSLDCDAPVFFWTLP